jgi:voltage-gated potassium channel Kch
LKNRLILAAGGGAFLLGLIGFICWESPGGEPPGLLHAAYYTLGLFVLSPSPAGLPSGQPAWAVAILWIAHFLAPLSLASFVIDALFSLLKGRDRSFHGKEGHTIVCGLGKTALLTVEEILKSDSPRDVVVVELFPDCPQLPGVREKGVGVVMGSMEEEAVLRRAGAAGAKRFLAFANDDILNINAVTAARRLHQSGKLTRVAQVTDVKLVENLPEALKKEIIFLNTYEISADALVSSKRLTHGYEDAYVVAGFGHFGQMVLKALIQDQATAEGDRLYVLDRDADEKVRMFLETFGFESRDVRPIQGNLHDPALWRRVRDDLAKGETSGRDPIVLVCTDNDVSNLSLALSIRRRHVKESVIYCRLFGEVSFEADMTKGHKIETFRVADLLRRNLPPVVLGAERRH